MKYPRIHEGEPKYLRFKEDMFECCCDCGMVHRLVIEREHGGEGVVIRVWRDNKKTEKVRKGGDVGLLKGASKKWKMKGK